MWDAQTNQFPVYCARKLCNFFDGRDIIELNLSYFLRSILDDI